ncbi:hypothetical protein C9F11_34645 [Streptomyces sp. YIM 121038]|uniref:DUF6777 domain-containing protein n=1 Tax=Streptomyces sp. YIM 121038 TaxID=2136401 RepID=UPI0011103A96|nr:DUF6777 domain-containing protein [Streptomyces sp. YIM 121038]QCX80512.1 hypothetical protein C9F11_34645 [Streptomyces sp. YIM 121038]
MGATLRTYATAFATAVALAASGCSGGDGDTTTKDTAESGRELFLQPVAAQGPDPFTASTARAAASPPPVTRSPQPSPTGSASPTDQGLRSLAGGTPGLYGGTHRVGSCDVGRQIDFLTADRAKAAAFAEASGIARSGIPAYLRGLTPVVLRADTRITNHGYRDGHANSFQSVLQAGTAVLVDDRGLPRVRCACGNPLKPPVAFRQAPRHSGEPWSGYRPTQVIIVTPAPRPITHITIINIVNNTWIERRTGDEDGGDDRPVPPPDPTPTGPTDPTSPDGTTPEETSPDATSPDESSEEPDPTGSDGSPEPDGTEEGTTPGEDTTSTDCPTPGTGTPEDAVPSPLPPGCPSPSDPLLEPDTPTPPDDTDVVPPPGQDTGPGVGGETVPDVPGLPDGPTGPDAFAG